MFRLADVDLKGSFFKSHPKSSSCFYLVEGSEKGRSVSREQDSISFLTSQKISSVQFTVRTMKLFYLCKSKVKESTEAGSDNIFAGFNK